MNNTKREIRMELKESCPHLFMKLQRSSKRRAEEVRILRNTIPISYGDQRVANLRKISDEDQYIHKKLRKNTKENRIRV